MSRAVSQMCPWTQTEVPRRNVKRVLVIEPSSDKGANCSICMRYRQPLARVGSTLSDYHIKVCLDCATEIRKQARKAAS